MVEPSDRKWLVPLPRYRWISIFFYKKTQKCVAMSYYMLWGPQNRINHVNSPTSFLKNSVSEWLNAEEVTEENQQTSITLKSMKLLKTVQLLKKFLLWKLKSLFQPKVEIWSPHRELCWTSWNSQKKIIPLVSYRMNRTILRS